MLFKRMPQGMLVELIYHVVLWLNAFPTKTEVSNTLSPRELSWECRLSAMSARGPKRETCNVGVGFDMSAKCHMTCHRHPAKTCCRRCQHCTTYLLVADMSAPCRQKKSHNNQITVVRGHFGRCVERPLKAFGDGGAKKAILASTMTLTM
jgi:hypothetical protein